MKKDVILEQANCYMWLRSLAEVFNKKLKAVFPQVGGGGLQKPLGQIIIVFYKKSSEWAV